MPSVTLQGAASAAATSVAPPAHLPLDLLFVFAYRDGATAIPTVPAAGGTVPTWLGVETALGANLNSAALYYCFATANNHTTGVWTNATGIICGVCRGAVGIGKHVQAGGAVATGTALVASALTTPTLDKTSLFLYLYGWRTVTAWDAAPANYTTQTSVATEVELLTKNVTDTELGLSVTGTASASGGYRAQSLEILGPLPPGNGCVKKTRQAVNRGAVFCKRASGILVPEHWKDRLHVPVPVI